MSEEADLILLINDFLDYVSKLKDDEVINEEEYDKLVENKLKLMKKEVS